MGSNINIDWFSLFVVYIYVYMCVFLTRSFKQTPKIAVVLVVVVVIVVVVVVVVAAAAAVAAFVFVTECMVVILFGD